MHSRHPPSLKLIASLLLATPLHGIAAESATLATHPSLGGTLLQLFLSLIVVLALLIGSLWLLKKLSGQRNIHPDLMRVISTTAVGGRERVVILEVGGTWLVLGVAPGRVNALAELPRQAMPTVDAERPVAPSWLRRLFQPR